MPPIHPGESKVLRYFGNMMYNSVALFTSVEVVKLTNHIGFWDTELAWYSRTAIQGSVSMVLRHSLGMNAFRPILPRYCTQLLHLSAYLTLLLHLSTAYIGLSDLVTTP